MNTGITRGQIQFIRQLQQKQGRSEHKLFMVEGVKNVNELLQAGQQVEQVYATTAYTPPNNIQVPLTRISDKELERISALATPNQVLALVRLPVYQPVHSPRILYCSQLQDPGNAGTILRIADWFGIREVVFSAGSVDVFSPKTVQASMGSLFRVAAHYDDAHSSILKSLQNQGYTIYAADMSGKPLKQVTFAEKCVIVMGSESHGILPEIKKLNPVKITIPGAGTAESLNVGVACGIICYQIGNL